LWNIFGYKKQLNDVVTYGFGHIRKVSLNNVLTMCCSLCYFQILEKKKQLIKEQKADSSNNKNFLSYLLKVTEEEGIWTDKEMMEETQTMVCAGSDTTALTMSFATIMLALHQDIQQKLYKEVYDIFGDSDRDATLDDLTRMEYTERVIRETMRLFPVGPCQFREVLEDIKIRKFLYSLSYRINNEFLPGDVVIPEGSQLLIPVHFIHRNPKYWPDPLKFNPDRFLPEEVEKRPRYSYMPFSIPPRNCIGITFLSSTFQILYCFCF
jgi:cytochrome P450 family 4